MKKTFYFETGTPKGGMPATANQPRGKASLNPFDNDLRNYPKLASDPDMTEAIASPGRYYAGFASSEDGSRFHTWTDDYNMESEARAYSPAKYAIDDAKSRTYTQPSAALQAGRSVYNAAQNVGEAVGDAAKTIYQTSPTLRFVGEGVPGAVDAYRQLYNGVKNIAQNVGNRVAGAVNGAVSAGRDFMQGVTGHKQGGLLSYLDYIK